MQHPDSTSTRSSESMISAAPLPILSVEPIVIQGTGHVTLFGLNNHFSTEIPNRLRTKVAPEEYEATIHLINSVLRKRIIKNIIWLIGGCFFVCCTLGCSLVPAIYFSRKAVQEVQKILKSENKRLYNRLGLNWSLHKQHYGRFNLIEYVLVINFLQKPDFCVPD